MNSVLHNFLHKSALKNWALTIPLDTLWTRFKNLIWKSFIIRPLKMVLRLSIVCSCFYRLLKPYHMMNGRKWREIPEKKAVFYLFNVVVLLFMEYWKMCAWYDIFCICGLFNAKSMFGISNYKNTWTNLAHIFKTYFTN